MSRRGQIRFLSRTARLYDPVVRAMGFRRLWDEVAERALSVSDGPYLDVCTGTGGVALALARRGASTVGLDLAPGMLARARRKARVAAVESRLTFVRMDARSMGFPDRSFGLVTCTMALHEMAEPERRQVLGELRRVARERVLVADYRVPEGAWGAALFRLTRAFEYLESDDFESYAGRDFRARLRGAGLAADPPWDMGSYRIWPCRVDAT